MDTNVQTLVDSIIAEKKISGRWPLGQLFTILDALTEYDMNIEKKSSKMKKFTGVAFLLVIIFMVGTIVAGNSSSYAGFALPIFVLSIVSLLAGIIGVVFIVKGQKKDLQNEFRTYLRPFLENLQEDIKSNSPIELNLYLSPINQKQFSKGRSEEYGAGAYHSCFDDSYERELLSVKLRLKDGNRIMLTTTELFVQTARTKRTPAGKLKTKYKYKKRLTFDTRVIVNPEKFYCKKLPTEGELRFYAKQSNGTPIIGVKFKEKLKGFVEEMTLEPSKTLENLMSLYAYVHPKISASANE